MTRYKLGIDMGIASIGWALIELNEENEPTGVIRDMGVRLFNSGREDKTNAPLAAKRRAKRSMRRQRERYKRRRTYLLNVLTAHGLMPEDPHERRQVADCTHPTMRANNPYQLRADALERKLTPYELGRVLFALNQRRGFKSNRLDSDETDGKSKNKIQADIEGLKRDMAQSGCRTLGQYFALRIRNSDPVLDGNKKGKSERKDLHTTRDMYEYEFDAIRLEQQEALTDDAWDKLKNIIFHQRPLRPVERGLCQIYGPLGFTGKEYQRLHKADPMAQEQRVWQDINNLKVREPGAHDARHLHDEERQELWALLQKQKTVGLNDRLCNKLGLESGTTFNLASAKKNAKLQGMATHIDLSKPERFGERWCKLQREEQSRIVHLLQTEANAEDLMAKLQNQWDLESDEAEACSKLPLEQGTARFCFHGMFDIVDLMSSVITKPEDKNRYMSVTEAMEVIQAYHARREHDPTITLSRVAADTLNIKHQKGGVITPDTRLKYYAKAMPEVGMHHKHRHVPEEKSYGVIGNPSVHIALNQLRKVVNAIIDKYDLPHSVAIELARDMKLTKDQKDAIGKANKRNADLRDAMIEECAKGGINVNPKSRQDFLKYKLWHELSEDCCNRKCIYSGRTISLSQLFSHEVNIEHILPRACSFDDSPANLTLAFRDENKMKGDQTPYEYYHDKPQEHAQLQERIQDLPENKKWRFDKDAKNRLDNEEGWRDNMLNDTKYISRLAGKYLRTICHDIQVSPGKLTAKARWQWFGNVEELTKRRDEDHRHHALDALTIALLSRSVIQKAQTASGQDTHLYEELDIPCPLDKEALRNSVRERMRTMLVSHRPDHGTEGQLHEETALYQDKKVKLSQKSSLTEEEHKKKKQSDGVKKFQDKPDESTMLFTKNHTQGKIEHTNYYAHGGVHHVDFWLLRDKKGKSKVHSVLVYAHEAQQQPPKPTRPHPAARFLMRLHKGDTVVHDKEKQGQVVVIRRINPSASQMVYVDVNKPMDPKAKLKLLGFGSLLKNNVRKAHIDILGRLRVGKPKVPK